MADNKANALKEAKDQYQLKLYIYGDSSEGKDDMVLFTETVDVKTKPGLIKFYLQDGFCYQYADTAGLYHKLLQDISEILDAVIVNSKQRAALDKIVEKTLSNYLLEDMAHENDAILDLMEH